MDMPSVCECGEVSELHDMTKCQRCEKTKCVDCFTRDEDAEFCDECMITLRLTN